MNIGFDFAPISDITSQHNVRGVGFYMQRLRDALIKNFPDNQYQFLPNLQKIPTDIALLHIPYFDPFFLHLPKRKTLPTVVTIHDLTPIIFSSHFPRGVKGELKWQIQKHLVKQSDGIITDSESSKKDIVRLLNYPEEKTIVVYLAADEVFKRLEVTNNKFQELQKKYNLPDKFILYVGDVTWNKNLPRLAKAIQKNNIPLVTIGKALINKEYDRNNIWNHDLYEFQLLAQQTRNIHNIGFVETEDLVQIYNIATALIMPSLYEGFGLPILEAMQSGCPVITSKKGSLPEIAREAALYIDAESVDSIAEGIEKLYNDTSLQHQLREKGLDQAKQFSWKKTAEETVSVYTKTL